MNSSIRKPKIKTKTIILSGMFAALTAIGAFIRIPLPEPFVPLTLQTLFVILSGMVLGAKRAALSQLIYIFIGLLGVPVFAAGGGLGYLLKPTFGYILGFVPAAYIAGKAKEKSKGYKGLIPAALLGLFFIYLVGGIYLYLIKNIYIGVETGVWIIIYSGILPFLPVDILSCVAAAIIGKKIKLPE